MGLDSYIQYDDEDGQHEIGYWRKCHFIHEFFPLRQDDLDFNCVNFYLDKTILLELFNEMCEEADRQNRSLEEVDGYDVVDTYDIDELKKVIKFLDTNPDKQLYYYGWY